VVVVLFRFENKKFEDVLRKGLVVLKLDDVETFADIWVEGMPNGTVGAKDTLGGSRVSLFKEKLNGEVVVDGTLLFSELRFLKPKLNVDVSLTVVVTDVAAAVNCIIFGESLLYFVEVCLFLGFVVLVSGDRTLNELLLFGPSERNEGGDFALCSSLLNEKVFDGVNEKNVSVFCWVSAAVPKEKLLGVAPRISASVEFAQAI